MNKKIISLLIPVVLFASNVMAESATKTFTLPENLIGKEINSTEGSIISIDNQKVWELTRIWPDKNTDINNYQPLEWLGKSWSCTENNHAGQPSIKIVKSQIIFAARNSWGKHNPGAKLPALIFNCPTAGTYSVSTNITYKTWDGNGKGAFLLLKASEGEISEVAQHEINDKIGEFDFSATNIELKAEDKLIVTVKFTNKSATAYTMKNFAIKLED